MVEVKRSLVKLYLSSFSSLFWKGKENPINTIQKKTNPVNPLYPIDLIKPNWVVSLSNLTPPIVIPTQNIEATNKLTHISEYLFFLLISITLDTMRRRATISSFPL